MKTDLTIERRFPQEVPGHRLWLARELDVLPGLSYDGTALFVMLNPSVADASRNDPTITRVCWFAFERLQAARLLVGNLFTVRATDPRSFDPGADWANCADADAALEWMSAQADCVVLAWGSPQNTRDPAAVRSRALAVKKILAAAHPAALTLGLTASGDPRHPLYVRKDVEMQSGDIA